MHCIVLPVKFDEFKERGAFSWDMTHPLFVAVSIPGIFERTGV
jgi:hypothetical protein